MKTTTWQTLLTDPLLQGGYEFVSFRRPPFAGGDLIVLTREVEWEPGDDPVPAAAVEYDLTDSLELATVRQVVDNATFQLGTPSPADLMAAMDYYARNDAFVLFSPRRR